MKRFRSPDSVSLLLLLSLTVCFALGSGGCTEEERIAAAK